MNINLKKRLKIFKKNFRYKNYRELAPFIHLFKIDKEQSLRLRNASRLFLNSAFKFSEFYELDKISKNVIRRNHKNISVSGIVVPKYYCSLEYNMLMREFYNTIENLGIMIDKWYTSLPIRIKFGDFVPKNFSIQDSGTLHVDSPTGFSTNCFAVFHNLAGDIKNNYIKYWKYKKNIKEIPYKLLTEKPNDEILELAKTFIQPLNYKLKFNEIIVADNVIYHQTIRKKNAGNRISIDNLCDPAHMQGKNVTDKNRKKDLVKTSRLVNIGKDFMYHYPHNDKEFIVTKGLKSPAYKKELRFK